MKYVILVLFCTACGTTWVKPGASTQDYAQDAAFCRNDAYTRATNAIGQTNIFVQKATYNNCLQSKGWVSE